MVHKYSSTCSKVARALGNVGAVHVCLGNHARAKELFERALPILFNGDGSMVHHLMVSLNGSW